MTSIAGILAFRADRAATPHPDNVPDAPGDFAKFYRHGIRKPGAMAGLLNQMNASRFAAHSTKNILDDQP